MTLETKEKEQKRELTTEEKTILDKLLADVNATDNSTSKYFKLAEDEKAVRFFLIDKSSIIWKYWDGKEGKYIETEDSEQINEQHEWIKYYRLAIVDPNTNAEQQWDLSNKTAVRKILEYCKNGDSLLKVKRIGKGLQTVYDIEPAN